MSFRKQTGAENLLRTNSDSLEGKCHNLVPFNYNFWKAESSNLSRSHPCEYSERLNGCWSHQTHPSFPELAPVHPFCKAGGRHVVITTPTHWKEAGAERKTEMRPLPGIKASIFLLSNLGSAVSKDRPFFPNRIRGLVYKKEEDSDPFSFD